MTKFTSGSDTNNSSLTSSIHSGENEEFLISIDISKQNYVEEVRKKILKLRSQLGIDVKANIQLYDQIGNLCFEISSFDEAIQTYQDAINLCNDDQEYSFEIADLYTKISKCHCLLGNLQSAKEYNDLAKYKAKKISAQSAKQKYIYARIHNNNGQILLFEQNLDYAQAEFEEAQRLLNVIDLQNLDLAETLEGLAIIDANRNNKESGTILHTHYKALSLYNALIDYSLIYARALNYYGATHMLIGRYEKAKQIFEESRKLQLQKLATHEVTLDLSYPYIGMGNALLDSGDDTYLALQNLIKAKEIREKIAPNSLWVAYSYNDLAYFYQNTGEPEKALSYAQKAIELKQSIAPRAITMAYSYFEIAEIFASLGKQNPKNYESALKNYHEAAAIRERDTPQSYELGHIYNCIGKVYLEKKNNKRAQEFFEKSIKLCERQHHDFHSEAV